MLASLIWARSAGLAKSRKAHHLGSTLDIIKNIKMPSSMASAGENLNQILFRPVNKNDQHPQPGLDRRTKTNRI
jgi:hypothetical protein